LATPPGRNTALKMLHCSSIGGEKSQIGPQNYVPPKKNSNESLKCGEKDGIIWAEKCIIIKEGRTTTEEDKDMMYGGPKFEDPSPELFCCIPACRGTLGTT